MTERVTTDERPEEGFQGDRPRRMLTIHQVLEIVPMRRTTLFRKAPSGQSLCQRQPALLVRRRHRSLAENTPKE